MTKFLNIFLQKKKRQIPKETNKKIFFKFYLNVIFLRNFLNILELFCKFINELRYLKKILVKMTLFGFLIEFKLWIIKNFYKNLKIYSIHLPNYFKKPHNFSKTIFLSNATILLISDLIVKNRKLLLVNCCIYWQKKHLNI